MIGESGADIVFKAVVKCMKSISVVVMMVQTVVKCIESMCC